MEIRNLGRSGLKVSVVGIGCNNFGLRCGAEETRAVVHKALDIGITLFDTADIYGGRGGSETLLGQALGPRRQDIILASKFGMAMDENWRSKGGSRRYIMQAVEASLKRLGTDWIDLYQLHRTDEDTPIDETLRALDDLVSQGKIRYAGCSNLAAWRVVEAQWTARSAHLNPFVSCQDEYSLVNREADDELIPAMRAYGLGLLPYYPLAGGLLTGKYRMGQVLPENARLTDTERMASKHLTELKWAMAEKLRMFAEARGHSLLELAFSWLAHREPVASVIAGATRPEQVEQNAAAVSWRLSSDDLAEIDRITTG